MLNILYEKAAERLPQQGIKVKVKADQNFFWKGEMHDYLYQQLFPHYYTMIIYEYNNFKKKPTLLTILNTLLEAQHTLNNQFCMGCTISLWAQHKLRDFWQWLKADSRRTTFLNTSTNIHPQ